MLCLESHVFPLSSLANSYLCKNPTCYVLSPERVTVIPLFQPWPTVLAEILLVLHRGLQWHLREKPPTTSKGDLRRLSGGSPRNVCEMNSDTWFPERLVSDRWVNSRLSMRLNCGTREEDE